MAVTMKVVIIMSVLVYLTSAAYQPEYQARLQNDLLSNYNKVVPPTHEGPIKVEMGFTLTNFDFIDEANFLAGVQGYSLQTWTDPRLRWDAETYNGTKKVIMEIDDLWNPDIEIFHSVSVTETTDTKAIVNNEGLVTRAPAYVITRKCAMDLYDFPYDKQRCSLVFGSWHHHGDTIDLTASQYLDLSSYKESADFILKDLTVERHETKYDCCPESYIDVTYYIDVNRKTGAYGAKLVMPSVLTGFLVLATFLLPTGSHEKITLCSIIFLCLIILLTYLHDIIPNSGDTILGEYLAFTLAIDFIATIIAVVAYKLDARSSPGKTDPPFVKDDAEKSDDTARIPPISKWGVKEWLGYLDIACFILFSVVYIIGLAILLGRR